MILRNDKFDCEFEVPDSVADLYLQNNSHLSKVDPTKKEALVEKKSKKEKKETEEKVTGE